MFQFDNKYEIIGQKMKKAQHMLVLPINKPHNSKKLNRRKRVLCIKPRSSKFKKIFKTIQFQRMLKAPKKKKKTINNTTLSKLKSQYGFEGDLEDYQKMSHLIQESILDDYHLEDNHHIVQSFSNQHDYLTLRIKDIMHGKINNCSFSGQDVLPFRMFQIHHLLDLFSSLSVFDKKIHCKGWMREWRNFWRTMA